MADTVITQFKSLWGNVVEFLARDATALAQGNGYDGVDDGTTRNAIAHAYSSADWAYHTSWNDATILGNLKEGISPNSDPNDTYKDQYNNDVGRRIAEYAKDNDLSFSAIDDLIIDALDIQRHLC